MNKIDKAIWGLIGHNIHEKEKKYRIRLEKIKKYSTEADEKKM